MCNKSEEICNEQIIAPISAIGSWQGYEYQGHITMNVVLQKIRDIVMSGKSVQGIELQIEGNEDFSIIENNQCVSLHQVKKGKVKLDKADKLSFIIGILQCGAGYGYFHINRNESLPSDFVEKTLEGIEALLDELKKEVVLQCEVRKDEESKYIIIEKIKSNTPKASVYNILNYRCKEYTDKNNVKVNVEIVKRVLEHYKEKLIGDINEHKKTNRDVEMDLKYVCVYESRFDTIREVKAVSLKLIKEILSKLCPAWSMFINDNYLECVYSQLMRTLHKRIVEEDRCRKKQEGCMITFEEILNVVIEDYHTTYEDVDFQYYKVFSIMKELFDVYPVWEGSECCVQRCDECGQTKECNLYTQMEVLYSKSDLDKQEIVHNLILSTPIKGKINNLPDDRLIRRLFLNVIQDIKRLKLQDNNIIEGVGDNSEVYRLSLDNSKAMIEFKEVVEKEISESSSKSLAFECDVLITDSLNENVFLYNGANIYVLEENELAELQNVSNASIEKIRKDYNKAKIIRVIDKCQAKKELK